MTAPPNRIRKTRRAIQKSTAVKARTPARARAVARQGTTAAKAATPEKARAVAPRTVPSPRKKSQMSNEVVVG